MTLSQVTDYNNAWVSFSPCPLESMQDGIELMTESILGLVAIGKLDVCEAKDAIEQLELVQEKTVSLLTNPPYTEAWEEYLGGADEGCGEYKPWGMV